MGAILVPQSRRAAQRQRSLILTGRAGTDVPSLMSAICRRRVQRGLQRYDRENPRGPFGKSQTSNHEVCARPLRLQVTSPEFVCPP